MFVSVDGSLFCFLLATFSEKNMYIVHSHIQGLEKSNEEHNTPDSFFTSFVFWA